MAKKTAAPSSKGTAAKKAAPAKANAAALAPGSGDGAEGLPPHAIVPQEPAPLEADLRTYPAGRHDHESTGLDAETLLAMYRNMLLQRRFEERAAQMYGRQKISGFLHLYIGQEALSTGAVFATRPTDPIITAYRDHGLGLARGMDTGACMAELFGKIDGCSRGKGGSMHFFDVSKHFYGGHGIVGGQIPVGVGMAFAEKYKETGGCSLTFFGDGAINQGAFHEAMNLAGLYDLPALIVCENNLYAMGTAVDRASSEPDLYKQAVGYNMTGAVVDGMDLFTVYAAFKELAEEARQGKPALVEVRTYRYRGHSMSDPQKYRTKEELEAKKDQDPIVRLKAYLLERELSTNDALDAVDEEVKQEVMDAVEFAENSPFPPLETMYEDAYVQPDYPFITND